MESQILKIKKNFRLQIAFHLKPLTTLFLFKTIFVLKINLKVISFWFQERFFSKSDLNFQEQ